MSELLPTDRYTVNIRWSQEDEEFVATVEEMPGCNALGSTRVIAALEIQDAIKAWIASATAIGNPVPPPLA